MEMRILLQWYCITEEKKMPNVNKLLLKNLKDMALTPVRQAIKFNVYFLQLIRSVFIWPVLHAACKK